MFGFEKPAVWQLAVEYCDDVYRVTRTFPVDERFGLTSQIRRASVSIASNIAEGSSRKSKKDFGRFVEVGYGSVGEVVTEFTIAQRQEFLMQSDFEQVYNKAERVARMLSRHRESLTG